MCVSSNCLEHSFGIAFGFPQKCQQCHLVRQINDPVTSVSHIKKLDEVHYETVSDNENIDRMF